MEAIGCGSYGDYLDYLEVHPEEFEELFDALLINVTSFFRDAAAWQSLRESVIPDLLARRADDDPIRVWSAGCASGQETYSLAMTLAEALGPEEYRRRVKIYGTDIDEDALAQARAASFTAKEVEGVPEDLLERYFERSDRRYAFRDALRRTVIFGRNNLLEDAPISRLDLLVCRNTMMYFTADSQERILRHFHFALVEGGALMLGKSEMMLTHRSSFAAIDLQQRIFRRDGRPPSLRARVAELGGGESHLALQLSEDERISRDVALEVGPQPMLLVSRSGVLTFANLAARALFGIGVDTLGRPFGELEVSTRPADLRGAGGGGGARAPPGVGRRGALLAGQGRGAPARGHGQPAASATGAPRTAPRWCSTTSTRYAALERELEAGRRDLQLAYEELQSTIDELETTNEELQSANEELQTTNEELQSTNEELETMNEELQSTNEELETINDELRDRTVELDRSNEFLEAILTSLGLAVAILDREHRVLVWNQHAEDLWGLRQDEAVGQHFLALDIGLPTERLAPVLRGVLGGKRERAGGAGDGGRQPPRPRDHLRGDRDGVRRTATADGAPAGAIVLMRDAPRRRGLASASRGPRPGGGTAPRAAAGARSRAAELVRTISCRPAGGLAQLLDLDRAVVAQLRQRGAQLGARRARDAAVVRCVSSSRGATTATSGSSPASAPISRRRIGTTRRASPEGRPTGSPRDHPGAVVAPDQLVALGELGDGGRDRRAARAHELSEHAVRERQRHEHAVARHAPPAVGEVPEQREDPAVDAVELRDRLRHRQPLRALVEPVDEDGVDLGPLGEPPGEAPVQHRNAALGQRAPADLELEHRDLVVDRPRAHHVAGAEQLGADRVRDDDLARDDPVEQEQPDVLRVGGGHAGRGQGPGGEAVDLHLQLGARLLMARFRDQCAELFVELEERVGATRCHAGDFTSSHTRGVTVRFIPRWSLRKPHSREVRPGRTGCPRAGTPRPTAAATSTPAATVSRFWAGVACAALRRASSPLISAFSSRRSAHSNSSERIASPIGITTNAGPGSASIAMPTRVTTAPRATNAQRYSRPRCLCSF